jgi:Mycothiol maleylpyruvate isomerase N-terminal domain
MTAWSLRPGMAAYRDGVTVICELAARFSDEQWAAPTPCRDWRAADVAGHLRCMADD